MVSQIHVLANFLSAWRNHDCLGDIVYIGKQVNRGTFSESKPSQVGYTRGVSALGYSMWMLTVLTAKK